MPAPAHIRVTWSGIFGTQQQPIEEWSFGLSFANPAQPFMVRSDMPPIAAAMRSAWGQLASTMHSNVFLTRTRIASVGNDGKVNRDVSGAFVQADNQTASQGSGAGVVLPPQVALAVTLLSDFAGPTGRGRFFLPGPIIGTLDSTLRITSALQTTHNAAVNAFLVAARNAMPLTENRALVIASGGSPTRGLPPQLHTVRRHAVGRVVDTIRSRRGRLLEEYNVSTLP